MRRAQQRSAPSSSMPATSWCARTAPPAWTSSRRWGGTSASRPSRWLRLPRSLRPQLEWRAARLGQHALAADALLEGGRRGRARSDHEPAQRRGAPTPPLVAPLPLTPHSHKPQTHIAHASCCIFHTHTALPSLPLPLCSGPLSSSATRPVCHHRTGGANTAPTAQGSHGTQGPAARRSRADAHPTRGRGRPSEVCVGHARAPG